MSTYCQQNFSDAKQRYSNLFRTSKYSDCSFLVGDGDNKQLFKAHKIFLAAASPVFEKMFYGDLANKSNPIVVSDVQPYAFNAMLQYIYSDTIHINSFNYAITLYCVAHKYMLEHVLEVCRNFLLQSVTPKDACRAYEFADLYDLPKLKKAAMQLIVANTETILKDPSFNDIEMSTLHTILNKNNLNINSEIKLFDALERFAKMRVIFNNDYKTVQNYENKVKQPVVENYLIEEEMFRMAVKKIRFLSMSPEEFAMGPALSKLLSKDEKLAFFILVCNRNTKYCLIPEGFSNCSIRRVQPYSYY